jgi:hypothetical protein
VRDLRQAAHRVERRKHALENLPGPLDGGQPKAGGMTVATVDRNPRPLRVTRRDDDLGCDVRRVVGYVATCDACGEQMPLCSTIRIARLSLEMHQLYRHGT